MFFMHQIKNFFPLRLRGVKEVNIVTVVSYALKYYKMRVAGITLRTELKSHPDYPSLLSVCDTFDSLEVEYRAVKTNTESLQKIDHPFLSFLSIGRGLYVFVLSVNSREVSYTTGDDRIKIVSLNEFSAGWSGTAVFIHKPAKGTVSGKIREYQKNYQSEKFNRLLPGLLLIIFFCVLLYRVLFNTGALHFIPPGMIVLSATKSLGLFFSLMLYSIELNAGVGRLLYRFCHLGPKMNCHSVLNSKVSTLWSEYGLAEAGISYFTVGLWFISGSKVEGYNALFFLALLSLPVILFSLLYQLLVIGKGCPLCLCVQFILIIEAVLVMSVDTFPVRVSMNAVAEALLVFTTAGIILLMLKLYLIQGKVHYQDKLRLLQIRRNTDAFSALLYSGKKVSASNEIYPIRFEGRGEGPHVCAYLSMNCHSCKGLVRKLLHLKRRSGNTSLQFVFSSMENPAGHILFYCLYYYAREGMLEAFEKLINNWYAENKLPGGMDMDAISYTESTALKVQNINSKEFMRSGITKVPVVCVNGFVIPDIYAVEDLPYLLDKIKCEAETIINGK